MWDFRRLLLASILLKYCEGILNIEELKDSKYALNILNKPLNELEIKPTEGLKLASRHGQSYYCKLPINVENPSEREEEKVPKSTPISSLLEAMRHEACLKTVKGWWTYEFCYGKYVKQYHTEGDVIKGDITYLGYYESDFTWKEVESSNFKRHKFNRYHSQSFVNGTACDVINHRRDTEIRYLCDDSSHETYIERVDEPSTCSYILTVRTPYICPHPHTKPLRNPKPLDIICRPVLTAEDYNKFEVMKAAAKNKQEAAPSMSVVNTASEQENNLEGTNQNFYSQVLKMFDALLPKTEDDKQRYEEPEEVPKKIQASEKEVEEQEAIKMIERFIVEERLQNLGTFHQKRLVMDVADLMKIYQHLPTADRARVIEKYVSKFVSTIEELALAEAQTEEYEDKTIQSLNNKLQEEVSKIPLPGSDEEKEEEEPTKRVTVHVRVHKVSGIEDLEKVKADDFAGKAAEDASNYDPTWKKLEEDIGKGLEDAGFETNDNHIEIRLITSSEDISEAVSLSTEEGERFRQMLLELMAGGTAMNKEVQKQKSLHDNYNLVWKKGSSSFASLSTFEEENEETDVHIRSPKL